MTPKELEVVYGTIEHVMQEAYLRGRADAEAQKPVPEDAKFKLSKASRLTIKTNIDKALKPVKNR